MYEKSPQSKIVGRSGSGMFTRMRAGVSTGWGRKENETSRGYLTMVAQIETTTESQKSSGMAFCQEICSCE